MIEKIKKTHYIKIENPKDERDKIEEVASLIRKGEIIAFPTETVFGVGVNALNEEAVKRLFKIKKRAKEKSLTYYFPSFKEAGNFVEYVPRFAHLLMEKFLPGPLTLVFKKSSRVPDFITGGSPKVGIRIPKNRVILNVLRHLNIPFVGTSANLSGRPPAVCPHHVLADLGGKIDAVVDGGGEAFGIDSTVLDVTSFPPRILRLGFISADNIAEVIGRQPILSENSGIFNYNRYNPQAKIFLLSGQPQNFAKKIEEISSGIDLNKSLFVLTEETYKALNRSTLPAKIIGSQKNVEAIAQSLFNTLREIEEIEKDIIVLEGVESSGAGAPLMDRLFSVADKIIKA